jgi:hypothetical protein
MRQSVYSALFCLFGMFSFAVLGTTEAAAQPGVLYVSKITPPTSSFNFNSAATWVGNAVPPSGSSIQIVENSVVVLDVDNYTFGVVNVTVGGSLDLGANTVTITDYLVNNGTLTASSSTVVFNSTVADNSSGQPTCDGVAAITFNDVQIPSSAVVDFGSGAIGAEPNTEAYVNGTLSMDGGAVVLYPPFYGGASTLKYNDDYTVSTEWTKNDASASTKGVPTHVEVADGASLSFGSTSDNYTCAGNLTVNGSGSLDMATMSGDLTVTSALTVTGASGSLDMSNMTGDIIVNGNCTIGGVASQSVTLTLPSAEGKGTLDVKGNLTLGESSANALTIAGDEGNISCGGNFTLNTTGSEFGMVEFDGAVQQTFAGNKITADSLVVSNTTDANTGTADVIFDGDVDIVPGGVFNPLDGTVDADGTANAYTFTMNSDENGTARIATLDNTNGGSNVIGDITFERYVPATSGMNWLYIGNYVTNQTVGDWADDFGNDQFSLFFDWDETAVASSYSGTASSWTTLTNTDAMTATDHGYVVLTTGDNALTLSATGGYNAGNVATPTLTKSNTPNTGGGWHVLTNPFPTPIDIATLLSENATFSSVQLYNNTTDNFVVSTAGSIDVGQSFWVQVSSDAAASFNTTQLTHGTNSFIREFDPLEEAFVGVKVTQPDGKFGKTYLRFHEESSPDWEWELDATHKGSGNWRNPQVFTILENGHELHINSMGMLADTETIPFTVRSGQEGTVMIQLEEGTSLPEGFCAVFEDLETGEKSGLGGDPMIVELDPTTTYSERFIITVLSAPVFEATASHCEGGILHFNGENAGLWDVNWEQIGGDITGSGCVTGLETGEYAVEAIDPFSQCEVHSNVTIQEVCMGDFNLNGERDITDLLVLLVGIQPVDNFEGTFPETDCDCDGAMTTLDLLMFLPQFGAGCE